MTDRERNNNNNNNKRPQHPKKRVHDDTDDANPQPHKRARSLDSVRANDAERTRLYLYLVHTDSGLVWYQFKGPEMIVVLTDNLIMRQYRKDQAIDTDIGVVDFVIDHMTNPSNFPGSHENNVCIPYVHEHFDSLKAAIIAVRGNHSSYWQKLASDPDGLSCDSFSYIHVH